MFNFSEGGIDVGNPLVFFEVRVTKGSVADFLSRRETDEREFPLWRLATVSLSVRWGFTLRDTLARV
jgi:hypothetical protein